MRTIVKRVTFVAAALMITALPVFAEEAIMGQQEMQDQKSECLLVARNCPTDSIQERIQRIQDEINRGTDVYTNDELRRLNHELQEAEKFLNYELQNGG